MARMIILAFAALVMLNGATVAQSINNEEVCWQPGYAMDPRCVGQ